MKIRKTLVLFLVTIFLASAASHGQSATTWEANLSDTEKVYGLSKFWSEVNKNFAYMDQVGGSARWDSLYQEFIPRVLNTANNYEYYRELERFCAYLGDGHTGIYYPEKWGQKFTNVLTSYFFRLKSFDDKVYIVAINESKVKELPLGSELVSINGVPVNEYIEKYIYPYLSVSASVKKEEALTKLFYGQEGKQYEADFCLPNGKFAHLQLTNGWFSKKENIIPIPSRGNDWLEYRTLGNGIHYIALNGFSNPDITKKFMEVFPSIKNAKGIVIDLRNNGGGDSTLAREIISHLTSAQALNGMKGYTIEYNAAYASWAPYLMKDSTMLEEGAMYVEALNAAKNKYKYPLPYSADSLGARDYIDVPVAVLCGSMTCSAAEDFLIYVDPLENFFSVGEPSYGSTGNPIFGTLPGGGEYRICTIECLYPDGRKFVNIGIQPDIEVRPTLQDYISDKDVVLERAVKELKKRIE